MLRLFILAVILVCSQAAHLQMVSPMKRAAAGGGKSLNPKEQRTIVDIHNKFRHSVSPPASDMQDLVWDDTLAAYAEKWAQCDSNYFTHSHGQYGENLFVSANSQAWGSNFVRGLLEAGVTSWNDEVKDFNYNSNSCSAVCGHYTQVVWATSTKVGCAYAVDCPQGKQLMGLENSFYLVCEYDPPGNWMGEKPYST